MMRRSLRAGLALLFTAGLVAGCGSEKPKAVTPIRIMPLGDSLTAGGKQGAGGVSYRGYLEQMLKAAGYSVDFVGTQKEASAPGVDPDHEGHGGFTIGPDESRLCTECGPANISQNLATFVKEKPDVVLLLIGVNEFFPKPLQPDGFIRPVVAADGPKKLQGLVRDLTKALPKADIFVASLVPWNFGPIPDAYPVFNDMARELGTASSTDRVFFVDLNGRLTGKLTPKDYVSDNLHLSASGAEDEALVWFSAMRPVLDLRP